MSSLYVSCIIFLAFHLIAIPAFIWSLKHRQITSSDHEMQSVLEVSTEAAPRKPLPWQVRLMMSLLIAIFLFILWSLAVTVMAAAPSPPANNSASQCPLGFK